MVPTITSKGAIPSIPTIQAIPSKNIIQANLPRRKWLVRWKRKLLIKKKRERRGKETKEKDIVERRQRIGEKDGDRGERRKSR